MVRFLPMFICLFFSFSQAQMDYNYWNYTCKNRREVDFVALATLESQFCPYVRKLGVRELGEKADSCLSRFRIIHILYSISDTLKKEFLESKVYINVQEIPMHPAKRHRPILIFGYYKDGVFQIEGYEDIREYAYHFNSVDVIVGHPPTATFFELICSKWQLDAYDIYSLHSIGTPYYDIKVLDSVDMAYYDRFLFAGVKQIVSDAGNDFNSLRQRLIQKRTGITASKIKNDFAALGAIRNVRYSEQTGFCTLNVVVETVFKNNTNMNIGSNIVLCKNDNNSLLNYVGRPIYLFGDLKDGCLTIESLATMWDIFVFGDMIYDISMGLSFSELFSYFLPSNLSFEEFENVEQLGIIKGGNPRPRPIMSILTEREKTILSEATQKVSRFYRKRDNLYNLDSIYFRKQKDWEKSNIVDTFSIPSLLRPFRCRRHRHQ